MNSLFREFLADHKQATEAEAALTARGLRQSGGSSFGVGHVEVFGDRYVPRRDGASAIILPAFDNDGSLYDLVAVDIATRRSATRQELAQILGADWIDLASSHRRPVPTYFDGLRWLRSGRRGVLLVDPAFARFALADAPGITCSDEVSAARLRKAIERPVRVPDIFVVEAPRAAA